MGKSKLLEEINYVDSVLEEGTTSTGEKVPYLLINGMVADKINANRRRYPLAEVKSALTPFSEEVSNGYGSAIMLADHPIQGTPPSVKDAAGLIKEVYLDTPSKTIKTKVQLLDNTQGNNILAIVKAGGKIGVSSRGLGNITEMTEDGEVVYEVKDFKLKGFDFVVFPSLGADATSEALMFEHLQEEIKNIFPNFIEDMKDLKESVASIQDRLATDDLDSIKKNLLETITKLASCGCKTDNSEVVINNSKNEAIQEEKEEVKNMKTIQEFAEQHPELYKELVDKVTSEVTETVTKEVTEKVTKEVTETVATEVKTALEKELGENAEKKVSDMQASLDEATKRIGEYESEVTDLKETTQPYIDILEGLVTFMRERNILVTEEEILKPFAETTEGAATETVVDETSKKLADEMAAVINEQKTKLDEALARLQALEDEKNKLIEDKKIAEAEKVKAEISSAISELLTKEPKYATLLKTKLESATSVEDVTKIYETEKAFIETVEKLNRGEEVVPAGEGKVTEAETVKEEGKTEVTESTSMSTEDRMAALRDYQRKLAGIQIKK